MAAPFLPVSEGLMTMKKEDLERVFASAFRQNAKYIAVQVETRGNDKPEIIINEQENFVNTLDYFQRAYDENMVLKTFDGIRIIDCVYADSFDEIEDCFTVF